MKAYFYTYKIVLLKGNFAGKYYFGQHRTQGLKDGCVEGVTYVKEILNFYNSQEELNTAEYMLIGDLWRTDSNCLNLCPGGSGNPSTTRKPTNSWWISDPETFKKYCNNNNLKSRTFKKNNKMSKKPTKALNKSQRELKFGDKTYIIPANVEFIKRYRNRFLFKRTNPDCFEVIKFKENKYPSDEDFGVCKTSEGCFTNLGMCISSKDINLESKIEKYLKYGF